jgi:hypothetical protein
MATNNPMKNHPLNNAVDDFSKAVKSFHAVATAPAPTPKPTSADDGQGEDAGIVIVPVIPPHGHVHVDMLFRLQESMSLLSEAIKVVAERTKQHVQQELSKNKP